MEMQISPQFHARIFFNPPYKEQTRSKLTWIFIRQRTGDRKNRIKAFQNDRIKDHLSIPRFDRQIGQMVTELCKVFVRIEGIHLLDAKKINSEILRNSRPTCNERTTTLSFVTPYSLLQTNSSNQKPSLWHHKTPTFNWCTALRTMRNAGGSGAFAKKSTIVQLLGANSFTCRQSS